MKLNPYLAFDGNCEEALNFYKKCLNGNIASMNYFESAKGMPVPESHNKKVLHATLLFGEGILMACDTLPGSPFTVGNNVSLSVGTDDLEATKKSFNALAEGGKITMPLQETFWGAIFGMLTDKYVVQWMFNVEK